MTVREGQKLKILTVRNPHTNEISICAMPNDAYVYAGDLVELENGSIRVVIAVQDYVDKEGLEKIDSAYLSPIPEVWRMYSQKTIRWEV